MLRSIGCYSKYQGAPQHRAVKLARAVCGAGNKYIDQSAPHTYLFLEAETIFS